MAGGAGEITCSPWDKKEAFLGYLYLRGYISGAGDVRTIDVDEEHGMANITIREYLTNVTDMENLLPEDEVLLNEQGVIPKRDDVRLSVSEVLTYSRELEERSVLFHRTGGVHCAALVHHGTFLSYKEDISRHVAVDKVVGDCLLRKIPMKDGILVFSGRVPVEILQKVGAMGCSVLIAKSAPTVSTLFATVPVLNKVSTGFVIIITTVLVAGIAAYFCPIEEKEEAD